MSIITHSKTSYDVATIHITPFNIMNSSAEFRLHHMMFLCVFLCPSVKLLMLNLTSVLYQFEIKILEGVTPSRTLISN